MLKKIRIDCQPVSGVHDINGFLFHHSSPNLLCEDSIALLHQHGIPYSSARFTPEEDEVIRRNWRKYAKEHHLSDDDALSFAGKGRGKDEQFAQRRNFAMKTSFGPKICHSLPHRSQYQIRRRMCMLFDPVVLSGDCPITYSYLVSTIKGAELVKLLDLYRKHAGDVDDIAKDMKRPRKQCMNTYHNYLRYKGKVKPYQYKRLVNLVAHLTKLPNDDRYFGDVIRRAIMSNRLSELEGYKKYVPFKKIAATMTRREQSCVKTWSLLMIMLRDKYQERLTSSGNRKAAFASAFNELFSCPRIMLRDFAVFVKMMVDATPEDVVIGGIRLKYYKNVLPDIGKKLLDHGITGFRIANFSTEVEYLYDKLTHVVFRTNALLFNRLRFPYTLKERLHIIALAYDHQLQQFQDAVVEDEVPDAEQGDGAECNLLTASSSDKTVAEMLQSVRTASGHEEQMSEEEKRKQEENDSLAFNLLTKNIVESVVVYSMCTYPDWIPPTKLKKYCKLPEIVELFPEEKNNDEMKGKEELQLLEDYVSSDSEDEDDEEWRDKKKLILKKAALGVTGVVGAYRGEKGKWRKTKPKSVAEYQKLIKKKVAEEKAKAAERKKLEIGEDGEEADAEKKKKRKKTDESVDVITLDFSTEEEDIDLASSTYKRRKLEVEQNGESSVGIEDDDTEKRKKKKKKKKKDKRREE